MIITALKFISLLAFIPLIWKYRLYSWIPVLLAGFADVGCWVKSIHDGHSLYDTKLIQVYSDICFSFFIQPCLIFYRFYITALFFGISVVVDSVLVYSMKEANLGLILKMHDLSEQIRLTTLFIPLLEIIFQLWRRRMYCFKWTKNKI